MDAQHKYNFEEVLGIYNTLEEKEREKLKVKLLKDELEFERLVKEDFVKYEETFKALA